MLLKFVNINAWLGGILLNPLLDFLKEQNADLVTLQEVYDGKDKNFEERLRSVEVFTKRLNYPHYYFAPAFLDDLNGIKVNRGNLILSKHPITDTKTVFTFGSYGEFSEYKKEQYPFFPRNLQRATIKFQGIEMNVFNTQGIRDLSGKDTPEKLKMSEIIINKVKDKQNVILAGDFNVPPNTQTIINIEKHLVNVFKNDIKSTFNMKRKHNPGYATAVVDMVFISENIEVVSKSYPQVDVSDYLPLVCEFSI